jgi:hypothetical protein
MQGTGLHCVVGIVRVGDGELTKRSEVGLVRHWLNFGWAR